MSMGSIGSHKKRDAACIPVHLPEWLSYYLCVGPSLGQGTPKGSFPYLHREGNGIGGRLPCSHRCLPAAAVPCAPLQSPACQQFTISGHAVPAPRHRVFPHAWRHQRQ